MVLVGDSARSDLILDRIFERSFAVCGRFSLMRYSVIYRVQMKSVRKAGLTRPNHRKVSVVRTIWGVSGLMLDKICEHFVGTS